jgi:hypothetical protein
MFNTYDLQAENAYGGLVKSVALGEAVNYTIINRINDDFLSF